MRILNCSVVPKRFTLGQTVAVSVTIGYDAADGAQRDTVVELGALARYAVSGAVSRDMTVNFSFTPQEDAIPLFGDSDIIGLPITVTRTASGGKVRASADEAAEFYRVNPRAEQFALTRIHNGVPNDEGEHVRLSMRIGDSGLADAASARMLRLYYAQEEAADESCPFIDLSAHIEAARQGIMQDDELIDRAFSNGSSWSFLLVYSVTAPNAAFGETGSARIRLERAFANLHLSGAVTNGRQVGGAAFGGFSSVRDGDAEGRFECYYPAYFYGGIAAGGMKIRSGIIEGVSIASGSYRNCDVTFDEPFEEGVVPIVMCTLLSGSTAGNHGRVSCGVATSPARTNLGFQCRIWNGDSSSRVPNVMWVAFAP